MSLILGIVLPLLLVAGVIVLVRTFSSKHQERSEGGDLVAYGLLAIFVGGVVWALFLLGRAAFPGSDLVGTSRDELAGALAGLIVAGPLTYYLWRRQDDRRSRFPDSVGWSLYLALTDAVYLTWLVVYAVLIVTALLGEGGYPRWTDVLIVAGVVGFHEWAANVDRPQGNISQIRRVVGSAIGLVTVSVGVGMLLYTLFDALYGTMTASAGDRPLEAGIAMTVVGGAVWAWRWLRPWVEEPDGTRLTYLVLVCYASLISLVAAVTSLAVVVITYFLEQPTSPGSHFQSVPAFLSIAGTAALIWFHHRPRLGAARTDSVRSYAYLLMATGLVTAIGLGTTLVTVVFEGDVLVDNIGPVAVSLVLGFAAAGLLWWLFWSHAQEAPRQPEAVSPPRRFYLIGLSILLGLTAAGAIVGVLFFVFQLLFDLGPEPSTLVIELSLAILSGSAAWHLYHNYRADAGLREKTEERPYHLTVICSHPGPLSEALPDVAKLKVIHRGDGIGVIDEQIAEQIVVATRSVDSIVWVGADGFESAPTLSS